MAKSAPLFYESTADAIDGPAYLGANHLAVDKYKKPTKLLENPDAIVIGSGIGGLGMASLLAQRKNWKVLLLEANKVPGGCTHCHEIDGFEWNTGIDSIGDMDPRVGRGLFRPTIDYMTGGKLQWAKMPDVHEICTFGEDTYRWYSSHKKNIEWVERQFPGEGNIRKYYRLEKAVEWWAWAWTLTKITPRWVPECVRELFYKVFGGKWRKYMRRLTLDVFTKELGFSKRLAAIFSYMYGNHGATPDAAPFGFHACNLLHYRDGAYYPVGGPGHIAECIVPMIEKHGGQLAVDCAVQQIIVEGNTAKGVVLEDGQKIYAPLIVSDASAHTTYMDLLPAEVADRHGLRERFNDIKPSPAHAHLLLGYDEEIDLPKEIIWHMPNYEGIDGYDLSAADRLYKGERKLEGMGGYILSPSARDPVYQQRYPGQSTVIALAEGPYSWIEDCQKDPEYKKKLEADLADNLERIVFHHIPELKNKKPKVRMAGIPLGCNPRAWEACSLGLEPSGERFVRHTHWLHPQSPVKNLYLTGQDSFSAGFAGSMLSARVTYTAITGNWLFLARKGIGSWP